MKEIKLNKGQQEKYDLIQAYLKQCGKGDFLLVGDNDAISSTSLDKIQMLKTKINVYYYCFSKARKVKDEILPADITHIYNRAYKNDESFKHFVDSSNL